MLWYLVLAASPVGVMLLVESYYKKSINGDKKTKKVYLFWCGVIVFLMIGLRNKSLGSVDSLNYYNNWLELRELPFSKLRFFMEESDMESGYLFTIWCVSRVFIHPQFVFVLSGLLFTLSVCRVIYQNSENVMLSMVMYICLGLYIFMVQGLRQSIAISICLLAIEPCKKRHFIRFALCIALAFCFHRTSIVFSVMYFFYGLKFTDKTKFGLIVLAVSLLVASPLLIRWGNQFLDREYEGEANATALIASAIYVIVLSTAYLFTNEKNTDQNFTFFVTMTMVGAGFYFIRYVGTQVMDRISFYFIMGQTIVLPTVIGKFESKSKATVHSIACFLCIALFIYRIVTSYSVPYLFFWQ